MEEYLHEENKYKDTIIYFVSLQNIKAVPISISWSPVNYKEIDVCNINMPDSTCTK